MPNLPVDESKAERDYAQLQQIVALTLVGTPEIRIAEQLGVSRHRVRKVRNSDAFKKELDDVAAQSKASAKAAVESELDRLAPKALKALEKALDEGKVDAVRTYFEAIGLKDKNADAGGTGVIQLILPGAEAPKVVDAIEVTASDPVQD